MTEPEQDIYGVNHDADSPSEEWVAGYIAATAAAEQRLRELTGTYRTAVLALEAIDVERLSRSLPEHYENDRDSHHSCLAYAESVAAEYALLDTPPPASPRQGEPVAVNIRRKPIPASVVRLMRIEQRPAGRGTIIVHEIDEVHPNTEACDICQLVTGAALSEPAES